MSSFRSRGGSPRDVQTNGHGIPFVRPARKTASSQRASVYFTGALSAISELHPVAITERR